MGGFKSFLLNRIRDPLRLKMVRDLEILVSPSAIEGYARPDYVERKRIKIPILKRWIKKNPLYSYMTAKAPLVLPGDWDLAAVPFSSTRTYTFLADLYDKGYEYKSTSYYSELRSNLKAGKIGKYKSLRLDSEQVLEQLFRGYVQVFQSMAMNGYMAKKAADAICVMVGRDGKLLKEEKGRHRLAIAQLVGVESVPVLVRHIHPGWLTLLGMDSNNPTPEDVRRALRSLPDFAGYSPL